MNVAALTTVLADEQGPVAEAVTPGVLGFIAVALIAAALYFLMQNMRKHIGIAQSSDLGKPADDKQDEAP